MSEVYYINLRVKGRKGIPDKLKTLLKKSGMGKYINPGDLVAVKIHFGERGNIAYIHPVLVSVVVDMIKKSGGKPFLTDTNTLYVGSRSDAVTHIETALKNGFSYETVGAPIVIADGIKGSSSVDVEINLEQVKVAKIAHSIYHADSMVVMTHFKAHELSGFGGAIKNVGMGCASREGKLFQHGGLSPKINEKKCTGCGTCSKWCTQGAIVLENKKARIVEEKCTGCGECIVSCPRGAVEIRWGKDIPVFQKRMTEYALAAVKNKPGKVYYLTFVMNVSPACDCYPFNDYPIVPDIGILASHDPVSIDQAAYDLVKNARGFENSSLSYAFSPGEDKFRDLYPEVDPEIQLSHGEKIGLGERNYKLIEIA